MLLFSRSCLPCKRRHEFRGNLTGTKWAQAPYNNVGPYFEAAPLCDRGRGSESTERGSSVVL